MTGKAQDWGVLVPHADGFAVWLARARGGYRSRGWCACGPARGATCSTGSASTAGARASAARCPKPTTPGLIAAAHNQLHAPVILIWG